MSVESGPRQRSVEREREVPKKQTALLTMGTSAVGQFWNVARGRGERESPSGFNTAAIFHTVHKDRSHSRRRRGRGRGQWSRARAPGPNPNPQVKYDDLSGVAPQTDRQTDRRVIVEEWALFPAHLMGGLCARVRLARHRHGPTAIKACNRATTDLD